MTIDPMSARHERALRWAAVGHAGQARKGSDIPYFQHVAAVAMILARAGFDEDVVIAGLLHDIVEDSDATHEEVEERFGPAVARIVRACSETKLDADGRKRPWIDRKRDHIAAIPAADLAARAVMLADKLHNLTSIEVDLAEGRPVWSKFNADRDQVLWYYREAIAACAEEDAADPRILALAAACRERLARLESAAAGGS